MLKLKLLMLLTVGSTALAANSFAGVIYDKGGMPRCISMEGRDLLLLWDASDLYSREIYTLDTGTYTARDTMNPQTYNCHSLPAKLSEVPKSDLTVLAKGAKSVGPFSLASARMQKSLDQIRNGATAYREETDAKSFLRKYPISNFTLETNRRLTAMYGVGFVSEIYAEIIASDPNNKAFSDLINGNLRSQASDLAAVKKNRTVIYVKGIGHELNNSKQYDVFVDNLRKGGVEVKIVKTHSWDTIDTNAAIVKRALEIELKKGKSLILIGLSKGGSESLLALSMLSKTLDAKPAGYGKVEAYLGLSGVYGGSFLVDWAGSLPQRLIMSHLMKDEYEKEGKKLPTIDGILDVKSEPVADVMKQVAHNGLPQETTYFSIVGAITGDGLAAKTSYIRSLQQDIIRAQLDGYGANDGYIEYPGTAVPKKLVKKSYIGSLNASHSLVDGTYQGQPVVGGPENVVNAISMAVFQILAK
ncbi:MAG: hypothetical protein AB7K68_08370 [Bacteriovoracia bacterium]